MEVQELENNADIRIKFASINERGGYDSDAILEYSTIFSGNIGDLAEGWRYEFVDIVETRFESKHTAWQLVHPSYDTEAAAIEHETGIEIIIGITSGVGTTAIVGLSKWLWHKWQEVRGPDKLPSSLVIERVTERDVDGRIRRVERIEMRGPIEAVTVNAAIERLIEDP